MNQELSLVGRALDFELEVSGSTPTDFFFEFHTIVTPIKVVRCPFCREKATTQNWLITSSNPLASDAAASTRLDFFLSPEPQMMKIPSFSRKEAKKCHFQPKNAYLVRLEPPSTP